MSPSQASRNQSQRCREQKPARPQPLLLPQREAAAAGVGARPSLGVVGVGVSLPGTHPSHTPSQAGSLGHSWDYSDGLMGSHSGLLSSCHLNTEASQPPILEDKHLFCPFSFVRFCTKMTILSMGPFFPQKPKWLNRYNSAG